MNKFTQSVYELYIISVKRFPTTDTHLDRFKDRSPCRFKMKDIACEINELGKFLFQLYMGRKSHVKVTYNRFLNV